MYYRLLNGATHINFAADGLFYKDQTASNYTRIVIGE
jgi:hypothetical protein